jgi:co-chaperonin GroES (HSP10)
MNDNFPIIPVGNKILIEELSKEEEKSEGGIDLVNSALSEGRVVAVSSQLNGVYNVGDIVLFPAKKGTEEPFMGKLYKWLDAEPSFGEIWGIRNKQ